MADRPLVSLREQRERTITLLGDLFARGARRRRGPERARGRGRDQ